MAEFLVTWKIDVEDVETPEQAAELAFAWLREPDTYTTVFECMDKNTGETVTVDLYKYSED